MVTQTAIPSAKLAQDSKAAVTRHQTPARLARPPGGQRQSRRPGGPAMPEPRQRSRTETRRDQSRALHKSRRRRARASPGCTVQGSAFSHEASSAGLDTSRRACCRVPSACRAVATTQAGASATRQFRAAEATSGSARVSAWPTEPLRRRRLRHGFGWLLGGNAGAGCAPSPAVRRWPQASGQRHPTPVQMPARDRRRPVPLVPAPENVRWPVDVARWSPGDPPAASAG